MWVGLLLTWIDINETSDKAAVARGDVHVVSFDWLLESVMNGKPAAEKTYLLGGQQNRNQTGQNGTGQKGDDNKDSAKVPPASDGKINDTTDPGEQDVKKDDEGTAITGKKRSVDQVDGAKEEPKKKPKDAKMTTLNIPVDSAFLAESSSIVNKLNISCPDPKVYVDDSGIIWDATLNQTVASANNNKFYIIQLIALSEAWWSTWTRWGRVGERGQSSVWSGTLDSCKILFQKKFREKSGLQWKDRLCTPKAGKYTFLERNYEGDDAEEEDETNVGKEVQEKPKVESALSKPLQDLISFIFNPDHFLSALASMSYDAKKLPLGKLSDRTLKAGFSILKELAEVVADPGLAQSRYGAAYAPVLEDLSNRYFTTIPHVFGRNRPPVLGSDALIKKEIELLEALTDMDVANEIMKDAREADEIHQLDRQFQSLGMEEMTRLSHTSEEFVELANYLCTSRGVTHSYLNYKVIDIFRIARNGETERFNSSPYSNLSGNSDRRLLWHGSRSTNFGGILSQGLRIAAPEAPVNGYMFGKGVYLADTSSKSANYCCSYSSANMGLLLLCDVELGSPMLELYDGDYMAGENAKKEGKIATLGQGRSIPSAWKDAEYLHPSLKGVKMPDVGAGSKEATNQAWLQYNEYIVYDIAQIRQRYLFYVHMY